MDTAEHLNAMMQDLEKAMMEDLEKRLCEVERVFGALTEMSATMETAVELLLERGLIDRGQLGRRADLALQSYRRRLSPQAQQVLQQIWESGLKPQLESIDEAEMGHA